MSFVHFRSRCLGTVLCGNSSAQCITDSLARITCPRCLEPECLRAETARLRLFTERMRMLCILNLRVQQLSRARVRKMQMQICRYREQTALDRSRCG